MESVNTLRQKIVRVIPLLAGIYAVAAGAISLLGWVTGFMRLADWNNSGITMKANAAFCSMLAGSALLNSVLVPRRKLLIAALSALVAIIGGLLSAASDRYKPWDRYSDIYRVAGCACNRGARTNGAARFDRFYPDRCRTTA